MAAMSLESLSCANCGHPFAAERWRRQRFCSRSCAVVRRGAANPRFNGGLSFNRSLNRWVIWCRDGTLVYYSRGVVAARLGRLLTPNEIVHHINEDTTDDRDENLEVTTRAEHIGHHRAALVAGQRARNAA